MDIIRVLGHLTLEGLTTMIYFN